MTIMKGKPGRILSRRSSRGQAAVELALALPVMVLLLFATADVGRWACASIEVTNAARAGVQYGAQSLEKAMDTAGMEQAALNDASDLSGMTANAAQICQCSDGTVISCSTGSCVSGQPETYVEVKTSDQVNSVVPIPGLPSSFTITGSAELRVQ